tara:strand:- start:41 stop:946 length:906 start_codon:yes stop_codon:yes gene_type:complete
MFVDIIMSSSPVFAVDASTGGKVRLLATSNKLHIRASELETKLDTLNTTCSNINVSVGDVDVNTDSLETLQTAGNASMASVDGKITACDTGAVAVSSSALPTGAATSANQNSGNESLADILTELQTPTMLATESTLQDMYTGIDDVNMSVQDVGTAVNDVDSSVQSVQSEIQTNGSKLDDIVSNTAGGSPSRSTSTLASGVSVADGVDIGAAGSLENIDMSSHKTLVISGSSSVSGSIEMYVSNDGGSTYFFAESLWSMSNYSGSVNTWYKVIENSPEMVKFKWVGGSTSTISFDVCKQNW